MNWRAGIGILLLATLSTTSCAADDRPPAALEFKSFDRTPDGYRVRFVSDVDLSRREDEMRVGEWLVCELDGDTDFSVQHRISQFARGDIAPDRGDAADGGGGGWTYRADIDFYQTLDQGTSEQYLESDEVRKLLARRQVIACRVVMTIYLGQPYYSRTMQMPVREIVAGLDAEEAEPRR